MIRVAVITVSDSAFVGVRDDESGPAVQRSCESFGWTVVDSAVVPDDADQIAQALTGFIEMRSVNLLLTTGGTGAAHRDVTPEATRSVIDRELPGLPELMRRKGEEKTPFAVLSRGVAGTRDSCLIINLPGSPKGAVESLHVISHLIPHVVDLLSGHTAHGTL